MLKSVARTGTHLLTYPSVLLVLAMLFWAGNTVAARLARENISPLLLVALRWIVVIAALWPLYGAEIRQQAGLVKRRWLWFLMMAAAGFTGFNVLFYYAAYSTTAVNIGILQGSMPIFVLAGAFALYGSRPSPIQVLGAVITALGVLFVATGGAPTSILHTAVGRGDALMLVACVLYSIYTLALRERPPMNGAAFFTLLAGFAALTSLPLPLVDAWQGTLQVPTLKGLAVALYVAIFPSCLAQIFFLRGVDQLGPSRAGVFLNLVPIFSALLAVSLLGEPFRWYHAVAMAMVVGGIWVAERGQRQTQPQGPERT